LYTYANDIDVAAMKRLTSRLRSLGQLNDQQVIELMQAEQYQYVYATVGGLQFDASRLSDSPLLEVVYRNNRVIILRQR
jgi:peptide subunit release factor RF-3